jgi:hypothetical protein
MDDESTRHAISEHPAVLCFTVYEADRFKGEIVVAARGGAERTGVVIARPKLGLPIAGGDRAVVL